MYSHSITVTGSDYEQVILNLMAMGYDRDNAVRAMQASFNNPDRAAEYLLTVSLAYVRWNFSILDTMGYPH